MRKTPQSFEAFAAQFMSLRNPDIGRATILEWSRALPRGGSVLDLGCGHGVPVSDVLVGEGFDVYGVDVSPTLVASYAARFPNAHTECACIEESDFFGRQFDGVASIGVIFFLLPDDQRLLIQKVSQVLKPGGRFAFTASDVADTWPDVMTGAESISLGAEVYRGWLREAGLLALSDDVIDEGQNNYYFAVKPT